MSRAPDGPTPAPESSPPVRCLHRRVEAHGGTRLMKGHPDGTTEDGFYLVLSGHCLDCGHPVTRTSPHVGLGPWTQVAHASAGPRYRRQGLKFG
jgi:hypothetical protein